jgi:hypothetical protein
MSAFSAADLSAAGIGLDVVGAYFVGRNVLRDPKQLAEAYTSGMSSPSALTA